MLPKPEKSCGPALLHFAPGASGLGEGVRLLDECHPGTLDPLVGTERAWAESEKHRAEKIRVVKKTSVGVDVSGFT